MSEPQRTDRQAGNARSTWLLVMFIAGFVCGTVVTSLIFVLRLVPV